MGDITLNLHFFQLPFVIGKYEYLNMEEIMDYEKLLDVGQVAEMLGLSIATIRKWVLTKYISYLRIGR